MKKLVAVLAVALLAMPAMAAPFYVAGSFNGWTANGDLMTEVTPNAYYTVDITSTANQAFKVTDGDWGNPSFPANNVEIDFGGGATAEMRFWPGAPAGGAGGWFPRQNRVGYDIALHGWEIMGSFPQSGWSTPIAMTDLGGGLYVADVLVPTAGTYYFKYRKIGDWNTSIGDLQGDADPSGDIAVTTLSDNVTLSLGIDMANGRYRIPEPTTLALLGFGGLALIRRRR